MAARSPGVHDPDNTAPKPPGNSPDNRADDNAVEGLMADIMVAALSLEYGTVTVTVKGGQVVGLERSEKRRLASPAHPPHKSCAADPTPHLKETL